MSSLWPFLKSPGEIKSMADEKAALDALTATEVNIRMAQAEQKMYSGGRLPDYRPELMSRGRQVLYHLEVTEIKNGLLLHISFSQPESPTIVYVESIDKVGDALVAAIVERRLTR
jgi:hypothetical protein